MDLAAGPSTRFQFASDQSLLVYFETAKSRSRSEARLPQSQEKRRSKDRPLQSPVTLKANENVRKLLRLLELDPVAGVRNLHPAYCSLLVKFDALRISHEELEKILRRYLTQLEAVKLPEPRRVEIPVCYGGEFGPDPAGGGEIGGMTGGQASEQPCSVEYVG